MNAILGRIHRRNLRCIQNICEYFFDSYHFSKVIDSILCQVSNYSNLDLEILRFRMKHNLTENERIKNVGSIFACIYLHFRSFLANSDHRSARYLDFCPKIFRKSACHVRCNLPRLLSFKVLLFEWIIISVSPSYFKEPKARQMTRRAFLTILTKPIIRLRCRSWRDFDDFELACARWTVNHVHRARDS